MFAWDTVFPGMILLHESFVPFSMPRAMQRCAFLRSTPLPAFQPLTAMAQRIPNHIILGSLSESSLTRRQK
jgi:hypothetical protein